MTRPIRGRRVPRALSLALLLPAVVGCAAEVRDAPLPAGVTIDVLQTRSDVAVRQLEVAVSNGTDDTITVTSVVFDSSQFLDEAVWQKESATIRPRTTANLPVLLASPDCGASNPRHVVVIEATLADGTRVSDSVEPVDRYARLSDLMAEDCLAEGVARIVGLSATAPPRVSVVGDRLVAELDVAVEPTGSAGTVSIDAARGTTLLAQLDPASGDVVDSRALGNDVRGAGQASVLTLSLVPNRCDPHAIAEDKRGTLIPLDVTVDDGTAGEVVVTATDEVRSALSAFVQRACAME